MGLGASATVAGCARSVWQEKEGRRNFFQQQVVPGKVKRTSWINANRYLFRHISVLREPEHMGTGADRKSSISCAVPIGRPSSESCVCGIAPDNTNVAGSGSSRNEIRCSVPLLTATFAA